MNTVRLLAVLGAVVVTSAELLAVDYYTGKLAARSAQHVVTRQVADWAPRAARPSVEPGVRSA